MSHVLRLGAVSMLLAGVGGLSGCASTTYGTGQVPEAAMFGEIAGNLGGSKKKSAIDYQPRAPLVMPPSTGDLPAPAQTADASNPDWPKDLSKPDAVAQSDEMTPEYRQRLKQYAFLNDRRRGSEETVGSADTNGKGNSRAGTTTYIDDNAKNKKFQAALAEKSALSPNERRYLTEPPLDYRQPAPTAPANPPQAKKKGFFKRMFSRST